MTISNFRRATERVAVVVLSMVACIGISDEVSAHTDSQATLLTLEANHIINAQTPQAPQTRTLSGRVRDVNGFPLAGAMVQVVEQGSNVSLTDGEGKYSLSGVAVNAVIAVSFFGYETQEINSGTSNTLDVALVEDSQQIDEVVVVGYGVQRKETLTGAVASIGADQIMSTKTDNLINNVQGKVAGLFIRQLTGEPGAFSSSISIRGFGDPIVVIDGVVRNRTDWDSSGVNELAQLNSEDIETFTVLKDASAAIYGMNSANGVIIVTTKKGNSGNARVSYNGMFGMKMPTGIPKMVDAYTYRVMENEFQRNVGIDAPYDNETLENYRLGKPGYQDHDWIDLLLAKAVPSHNHTLAVRGGTDKVGYYASLGYSEDNGLFKNGVTFYKRYSLSAALNAQLAKNLKLNFNITGRTDEGQNEEEPFVWTYKSLIIADRGIGPYTLNNPDHYSTFADRGENKNPYALVDPDAQGYNRTANTTAYATLDLTYTMPFIPGMSLNVLGAYDNRQENGSALRRKVLMYDYRNDNGISNSSRGSGSYNSRLQLYHKTYGKVQLNYARSFGDHSVSALAAGEASQERWDRLEGTRTYEKDFVTSDILNMASPAGATNAGYRQFRRMAAFLGRVNYDYRGKYLFEAMLRYDGSYRYSPEMRWATFPSVSAGWRITEESWLKNKVSWLNNLKVRASWGQSGRDQGNPYAFLPAYNSAANQGYIFSAAPNGVTPGFYPPGVVNNNMTWVKSTITNVGVDITVLKNLNVTLEWYERRQTGILANRIASAPDTFGASFPQENINSQMNTGLELDVRYTGKVGNDFSYTLGANVSYTRFKFLHRERAPFNSQWDRWKNGEENRYSGRLWMYDYDGQYRSKSEFETAPLLGGARGNSVMLPGAYRDIDANGDGRINGDDQLILGWSYGGSVNPPLQFGFTMDFSYKSWDLGMLFQGAALYRVRHDMNDIWGYGRYDALHSRFLDRWHTASSVDPSTGNTVYENPLDPNSTWIPGKFPAGRPYGYNNTTDANRIDVWVPSAAYLRLKNIELGYSFPKSAANKIGIQGVRLYVNATNLLTIKKKGMEEIDPERSEMDWDAGTAYPIMKAVNVGVNISF